jgi:hypothetical protein
LGQQSTIYVDINESTFEQPEHGVGTCYQVNGIICSHQIEPGNNLVGVVPYSTLGVPEALFEEHKVFRYYPAYWFTDMGCAE